MNLFYVFDADNQQLWWETFANQEDAVAAIEDGNKELRPNEIYHIFELKGTLKGKNHK